MYKADVNLRIRTFDQQNFCMFASTLKELSHWLMKKLEQNLNIFLLLKILSGKSIIISSYFSHSYISLSKFFGLKKILGKINVLNAVGW